MKKYGLRVLVGLFAFVVGVGFVWSLLYRNAQINVQFCDFDKKQNLANSQILVQTSPNGKIELHFKGFHQTKDGLKAVFVIENHTTETIYYSDYEYQNSNEEISPLFETKINGKESDKMWCGTGLSSFPIKSGETKLFTVYSNGFIYEWKKGEKFQIGFNFSKKSKKNYETVWSENLPMTKEVENQLSQEKLELEKLTK